MEVINNQTSKVVLIIASLIPILICKMKKKEKTRERKTRGEERREDDHHNRRHQVDMRVSDDIPRISTVEVEEVLRTVRYRKTSSVCLFVLLSDRLGYLFVHSFYPFVPSFGYCIYVCHCVFYCVLDGFGLGGIGGTRYTWCMHGLSKTKSGFLLLLLVIAPFTFATFLSVFDLPPCAFGFWF